MSAALQLPLVWAARSAHAVSQSALHSGPLASAVNHIRKKLPGTQVEPEVHSEPAAEPVVSYAFYRKYTENLLRRYLYASTQVGRSPSLLGTSVGRGWVSSRKVRTFEDALIFVLDVERCLKRLSAVDRQLISRVVIQEYTQSEAAAVLGISVRTVCTKLAAAIDRLTKDLVDADLLVLPD